MKSLIITQRVDENDQLLSFFIGWILEFTKHFEKITIICLYSGKHNLPSNIKVLSLGKEIGNGRISQLLNFYKYIWQGRNDYDVVFVHMNPIWMVLGGPIWRMMNKTASLWYAHGHVSVKLRIATVFSDIIFSSTPEGFRLKSDKIKIVGQGIDTDRFAPSPGASGNKFKIFTIGRISSSKDYETLVSAADYLIKNGDDNFTVDIVGSPVTGSDSEYFNKIKAKIDQLGLGDRFNFIGTVPNKEIVPMLQSANVFVNMGHTGSLDKVTLEAMACGLPMLTCNEALTNVLGVDAEMLMYPKKDFKSLAEKIILIKNMNIGDREMLSSRLRNIVVKDHNLKDLIRRISTILIDAK